MILKMNSGMLSPPQYFRVISLPAVLGRASGADVWVPHPQISGKQARFEQKDDGKIWIFDLGGSNGLRFKGVRVQGAALNTGCVFELGSLRFEVDLEDGRDRAEIPSPDSLRPRFLGDTQRGHILSLFCLSLQALAFYLGSYHRFAESDMSTYALGHAVLTLPMAFVSALGLALVSKLHGGEYRYWPFFRRCSLALTAGWIWWISVDAIAFNLPGSQPLWLVSIFLLALWVLGAGYSIARLIFAEQPAGKIWKRVALGDALLLGFMALAMAVAKDSRLGFSGVYSVPLAQWKRPTTAEAIAVLNSDLNKIAKKRLAALTSEQQ